MTKKNAFMSNGLIASFALIMSATNIFGQKQDSTKLVKLNEVVVTATRSEKHLGDVGRSVTVINSNEIKNSGVSTVSELLNQEEGIYIVGAQQNPGSLNNLYTRGANSNHTVVLVDGIRITDPTSANNTLDLSELSLANIDRIEIVRGSHSTLYGSSAIGGVVNIITNKNNNKPGMHVDADVSGGVFNKNGSIVSENMALNYTHKSGLYVNAEVFNSMSEGFNSTMDTITNPNTFKFSDRSDGFTKTDLIGKIGYSTKKVDLYIGYKNIAQKLDIDDGAFRDDDNFTSNFKRNLFTYGATFNINDKFSLRVLGGMSDMVNKLVNDSSIVDYNNNTNHTYLRNKYVGSNNNNEFQANYKIKGLQLIAGASQDIETMSVNSYYYSNSYGVYVSESDLDSLNIHSTTTNGFLHADINGELINESFKPYSFGFGVRYVNHSAFGTTLTYEVNPSVKINENSLLYFSYSTGFNAPSLYQLYSPEKDFSSGITRGNKTLEPEKSSSWEIGLKQKVNDNLWWSACYFNTVVENVVDYVYLWNKDQEIDSLSYMDYRGDTYINLGTQTNRGVEFSVQSKISDKLIVSGNFSLVNGKLDYKPEGIDTTHTHGNHIQLFNNGEFISKDVESIGLVRRPNTANISLTYMPVKKLALRIDVKYVGTKNDIFYNSSLGPYGALGTIGVEDYTLLDFSAKYQIIKGLSAMFRIENIFDTKYYEIRGYATRGRGFYGGLRYSI